jgi:hypothetical protein
VTLQHEDGMTDTRGMPRHWKGMAVLALVGLAGGAVLVTWPWSGNAVPVASEYSSPSDLVRDLNDHGLGCSDPTWPRLYRAFEHYMAIFIDRGLIPDSLVCSVDGRPVILTVYPPASLKVWFDSDRYMNFQDAAAHGDDSLIDDLGLPAMLFGPNWLVTPRQERDSTAALSAIRGEIGGTLLVAASSTGTPSPSK